MNNLKRTYHLTFCLVMCFLFFFISENKAQQKKMSDKDLTDESTAVFYGKCSKKTCTWDENHRIIFTYVTIVPEEYLKGNLGTEAVVAVPGGQVGDIIYEVSEMPVFTEGEEVVAFVWKNPSGKNLVTGGSQGKMKIEKDKKTGKRMVKTKDTDSETNGEVLENFVEKVKGYMKH
jgi:hypothetical protein